jgi:hypothetical protein
MTEILPNNLSFCNADCFNPVDFNKLKNNKDLIDNYIEGIIIDNNFINTNILNLLLNNLDTAEIALLIIEKLCKKYSKYDEKINLNNQEISDVVLDSLGNEIKVKKEKVLTAREKKKRKES